MKAGERTAVLSDGTPASLMIRRPAIEFTFTRLWRISAVIGSYVAVLFLLIQLPSLRSVERWIIAGGAVFVAVGLNLTVAYLMQWVAPGIVSSSPLLIWTGLLAASALSSQAWQCLAQFYTGLRLPSLRSARLALMYCVMAYTLLFLVRLDFDGDFFNNWLPQGRFHYLLGRHDPTAIIAQGSMQGASYPPGFGIGLSTLMWASGMKPAESFLIGPESSFAILMYRLFFVVLNVALMMLLVTHLRDVAGGDRWVWVASILLLLLLVPSTAGKHIASETLLFPMMAAAILLVAAGRRADAPGVTAMGLAVGGMSTLLKTEASLIFALAVLPWLVSSISSISSVPRVLPFVGRASRRVIVPWAVTLGLSLLPVLIWKITLKVHNEFFLPVTWPRFAVSLHLLPGLTGRAVRWMLDTGLFVFLILGLPCAMLVRLRNSPRWPAVVAPLGIASLFAGFIVIFLFCATDPQTFFDNSYSRLVMVPTFGAILYCAEAAQALSARSGSEVEDEPVKALIAHRGAAVEV